MTKSFRFVRLRSRAPRVRGEQGGCTDFKRLTKDGVSELSEGIFKSGHAIPKYLECSENIWDAFYLSISHYDFYSLSSLRLYSV